MNLESRSNQLQVQLASAAPSSQRDPSSLRVKGLAALGLLLCASLVSCLSDTPTTPPAPAKPNLTGSAALGAGFVNPALERATLDELIIAVAPVAAGKIDPSKPTAKMLAIAKTAGSFSASSAPYGFENLPLTPFVLLAVKDVNANKKVDAGDYLGWYSSSGSGPSASVSEFTPPSDAVDVDVDKLGGGLETTFAAANTGENLAGLRSLIASLVANPPAKPALPVTPLEVKPSKAPQR
jgi:hypothetical protein